MMDRVHAPAPAASLAGSIAAVLDWWCEAGVDHAFTDEPRRWLADPPAPEVKGARAPITTKAKEQPAPEAPRIGGEPAGWPRDLAAFREWWLGEPSLDPSPARRVPPRGNAGAKLLVLVPMPEEEDGEALLSGAQGRLVAAMARAMGTAEHELYLASALPRHMPLPDWAELKRDGLGEVLRHHLALAAPERVLVLGGDILPLLGHDLPQATSGVCDLGTGGGSVPFMGTFAPASLLEHARLRRQLWQKWLDWTDKEER